MKKIILLVIVIGSSMMLASCNNVPATVTPQNSYQTESEKLKTSQAKLIESSKTPILTESLERNNIIKRAELFNKSDKLSYIYLVSYGKIMSFHTVKGKISSVSSYLTPQERLVNHAGKDCEVIGSYEGRVVDCISVQAPDIDGSYGTNGEGIFFFTTEGAYVEWKGEYLVSDFPLKLTETPSLVKQVK